MRCPTCGSPAMVRGDRWECGYCGDSGFLSGSGGDGEISFSVEITIDEEDFPEES